ncbi:MAG: hypothetical protein JWM18_1771 [Chloroflexi bacterium]|nr:hypothetical protein [Chloroflexota bacterium]
MGWFSRRGRVSMPRPEMVEVPDTWSLGYDGSPLQLERRPQLGTLLSSPEAPFDVSGDPASGFWNDLDLATQRRLVASAHLRHPDGEVRRETLTAVRELDIDLGPVPQELADVLFDELPAAREEAARLIRGRGLLGLPCACCGTRSFPGTTARGTPPSSTPIESSPGPHRPVPTVT